MNFLSLSVNTSNIDLSSICRIGIVEYENDQIQNEIDFLINPEDFFDTFNISINKIDENDVINCPTFKDKYEDLIKILENKIVIYHSSFYKTSIIRACEKYELKEINTKKWLNSSKIVKHTWPQFINSGYGIYDMSYFLKINIENKSLVLENAIITGKIFIESCFIMKLSIENWFDELALNKRKLININNSINLNGAFYGQKIVFTGKLSITRTEISKLASEIGFSVMSDVTKQTNILVVGIQNVSRLCGYEKSSKHRKAEELIKNNIDIKILTEEDFNKYLN